jgi:hypothetical protein
VANRERASVFSPTGRHRVDATAAEEGPRPSTAGAAQPGVPDSPPWGPASPPAPARREASVYDPLRPSPGQGPFGQRLGWSTPAPEATPEPAAALQAEPDQVRRSATRGSHRGLPRRVRQASLAPQLRDRAEPAPGAARSADDLAGRSPEEVGSMMSSLQDGWQRGRMDHLDDLDYPDDWPGGTAGAPGGNDGEAT